MSLPMRPADLPTSLVALVETIGAGRDEVRGLGIAMRLMAAFGGRDVKFPVAPAPGHPVVAALGQEDADLVCALLGGAQVYIPHGRKPRSRRAEVLAMEARGLTRAQIATALGLSERQVRFLANRRSAAAPLPLFPEDDPA